jgi:hypothetical protein
MRALSPVASAGVAIQIPAKSINFTALVPIYTGREAVLIVVGSVNAILQIHEPIIRTFPRIALSVIAFKFKASPVAYVGEASEDGYNYIAIVEDQDGEPLEASVRGCAYGLIRDLKNAGLWNKFLTIVPTCMARTVFGAFIPLTGRFPIYGGSYFQVFNYNRVTGVMPKNTPAGIFTGFRNNEIPGDNNHLAAYVTKIRDVPINISRNLLIGDEEGQNAFYISKPTFYGSVDPDDFLVQNKGSGPQASVPPHWSQPSLVGMTRANSSNYTLRVANTDRTVSSFMLSQSEYSTYSQIKLFNSGFGLSDFRVAIYSIGEALDLETLEGVIETFLNRLSGILGKKIFPPNVSFQVEALPPIAVGNPPQIFPPSASFQIEAKAPVAVG